jgi:uncharacterized protein (TIGR02145 family)
MKKVFSFLMFSALFVCAMSFSSCEKENDGDNENNPATDAGVVINGVTWATRNVNTVGTFAAKPESAEMIYQWNRKTAWAATGDISNWDSSIPSGTTWEKANDPSPVGWRVPTRSEMESLCNTEKVSSEKTVLNGVNVRKFTDKATGKSLILPVTKYRAADGSSHGTSGTSGEYWSSTRSAGYPYRLDIYDGRVANANFNGAYALPVRCVAE